MDDQQRKIYLINDGEVTLLQGSNIQIATLKSGEMFGLNAILEGVHSKETAVSKGFSSVYTISEQDLLDILRENKIDYVIFYFFFCFILIFFLNNNNDKFSGKLLLD